MPLAMVCPIQLVGPSRIQSAVNVAEVAEWGIEVAVVGSGLILLKEED